VQHFKFQQVSLKVALKHVVSSSPQKYQPNNNKKDNHDESEE